MLDRLETQGGLDQAGACQVGRVLVFSMRAVGHIWGVVTSRMANLYLLYTMISFAAENGSDKAGRKGED